MADIEPFGTDSAESNPFSLTPPIFLGLTVVDFSCNSSWSSEGGQCTIKLIQDDGQYLENAVVGSPQYFEILSSDNEPVFRFYGILMDMARSVSAGSKMYSVTLQSPTLLLEAPSLIIDSFAGYGGALEASGPNITTCLDFGSKNSTINTSAIYNILNLFGVFENDTNGLLGAGFGRAVVNDQGMRVDAFAYALNEILNGNPVITPALGSNIIYGADSYVDSNAYAYNFDVYGFLNQIASFLPNDYRVQAATIMDFVNELCSLANHIYYVDLLKPPGGGSPYFSDGHTSTYIPTQTHANTVYGGQIVVITQNRNNSAPTKFPLSAYVVGREASDKLGGIGQIGDLPLDIGMTGDAHPDGPPVASSPFGGESPVESITPDETERFIDTNLKVRLNSGAVSAKYVVGGYQSRINYVCSYGINNNKSPEIYGSTCSVSNPGDLDPTPDVYWYWGDINIFARTGVETPNVPVVTPILDHPDARGIDVIAVDLFESMGDLNILNLISNGIYLASVLEIVEAKNDYQEWLEYLIRYRPQKIAAIGASFNLVKKTVNTLFTGGPNAVAPSLAMESYRAEASTAASKTETKPVRVQTTQVVELEANFQQTQGFLNTLWQAMKDIGEAHYGKTFIVKSPAFTIKQDVNSESPLGSYIKSWDLSQDGYLDPISYADYEAPEGSFVKGGRLSAYANYYLGIPPKHDMSTAEPIMPMLGGNDRTFSNPDYAEVVSNTANIASFKNFTRDEKYIRQIANNRSLISVPTSIDENYVLLPSTYFTFYNPVSTYNSPELAINFLTTTFIPYNGLGCVPYAKCETKGVFNYVPWYEIMAFADESLLTPPESEPQVGDALKMQSQDSKSLGSKDEEIKIREFAVTPKSFGIPQQSNRYVYGPWATENSTPYGAKVEYVKDDSLVPEKYILPSSVSFGGTLIEIASGYDGMNTVGRLMANTVENFDFLFTEEGSLTIAGYPQITHLGQALVEGGPLVSDISVNITASQVTTSYNMTTFAPKFGRTNKYLLDRLTSLARRMENGKQR